MLIIFYTNKKIYVECYKKKTEYMHILKIFTLQKEECKMLPLNFLTYKSQREDLCHDFQGIRLSKTSKAHRI